MKSAPTSFATSTTSLENCMTRTLSRCASDSSIMALRSSSENSGSPFCGLRMAATTTSSNRYARRLDELSVAVVERVERARIEHGRHGGVSSGSRISGVSAVHRRTMVTTVVPYRRDLTTAHPGPASISRSLSSTANGTAERGQQTRPSRRTRTADRAPQVESSCRARRRIARRRRGPPSPFAVEPGRRQVGPDHLGGARGRGRRTSHAPRPARQRFDPHRAAACEQVEHRRVLDHAE